MGRRLTALAVTAFFLQVVAMVFPGTQIQQCEEVSCCLLSAQSLPHNLALLYRDTGLFRSADLSSKVVSYLNAVKIWADSHGFEIALCDSIIMLRNVSVAQPSCHLWKEFSQYTAFWASSVKMTSS